MSDQTPPPPPSGSGGFEKTPPPPPAGGGYGYTGAPPGASYGQGYGQGYGQPPTGRPGELLDRFLARFIDLILVGVINGVITAILIVGVFNLDDSMFGIGGGIAAGIVSAVLSTVIGLGYFAVMESSQGKTVGKMILKLHVLGASGGKPTLEEAVKRNIWMALPILGIVPILGGLVAAIGQLVAVITIAIGINNDPIRRQPWTDKYAGTQVVKGA